MTQPTTEGAGEWDFLSFAVVVVVVVGTPHCPTRAIGEFWVATWCDIRKGPICDLVQSEPFFSRNCQHAVGLNLRGSV